MGCNVICVLCCSVDEARTSMAEQGRSEQVHATCRIEGAAVVTYTTLVIEDGDMEPEWPARFPCWTPRPRRHGPTLKWMGSWSRHRNRPRNWQDQRRDGDGSRQPTAPPCFPGMEGLGGSHSPARSRFSFSEHHCRIEIAVRRRAALGRWATGRQRRGGRRLTSGSSPHVDLRVSYPAARWFNLVRRSASTDVFYRGHSTPGFTMATYQHIIPGMQKEAAHTFAGLLVDYDDLPTSTR